MDDPISICIPSCDRPDFLKIAIESCFAQAYRPLEILIGDDSTGSASADMVAALDPPDGIVLRYHHNRPRLGQSGNVNALFDRAGGPRLMLLHDDDLLCPGGLDALVAAWPARPHACVYGRQDIVDPRGRVLTAESAAWNQRYFRIDARRGPQPSAMAAALWQQVPNNCYLIRTADARAIRYRPESEIGQCVDAEFVVRLAEMAEPGRFVFVDRTVSRYRLTPLSIARSRTLNKRQDLFFQLVRRIPGDAAVQSAKAILLGRISEGAALDAALAGDRRGALSILFSRFYERRFFTRWTLYRLVCTVSPGIGGRIKRAIDRREAGARWILRRAPGDMSSREGSS